MSKIVTKPVTFGGPTSVGSPYWKFKKDIKDEFKNHKKLNLECGIDIRLYLVKSRIGKNKNDLDNFIKPIIDAIHEIDIIEEHKIKSIRIERIAVDDHKKEGVDISFL